MRPKDIPKAEAALRKLAKVVCIQLGKDYAALPGAGAAGGLGFGLAAFAGACLQPGFDVVARAMRLDAQLKRADLVITGEGRLDASTLMGKGVGELAMRCRQAGVPCLALGGCAADRRRLARKFSGVATLTDLTSPEQAQTDARRWLERLGHLVALRTRDKLTVA